MITREQAIVQFGPGWTKIINDLYDLLSGKYQEVMTLRRHPCGGLQIVLTDPNLDLSKKVNNIRRESRMVCECCGFENNTPFDTFILNIMVSLCPRCSANLRQNLSHMITLDAHTYFAT